MLPGGFAAPWFGLLRLPGPLGFVFPMVGMSIWWGSAVSVYLAGCSAGRGELGYDLCHQMWFVGHVSTSGLC